MKWLITIKAASEKFRFADHCYLQQNVKTDWFQILEVFFGHLQVYWLHV